MFRSTLPILLLLALPTLAEAQTGDRARINGMELYYEVSGAGEPLVVLHGAYMNIPSMGEIVPMLARTHRVYALELQGHGRTTDIDRPMTYQHFADDVVAFMDSVGLESANVFGYSVGAVVGLQIAIRHPERIRKLVALSAAYDVRGWQPAFTEFLPHLTPDVMMGSPFEAEYRALQPDGDFRELATKLIALEHEPMAWEAEVRTIRAPVLLITGDADVATLEHSVSLFRLLGGGVMGDMGQPLPASRLAVLPGSSHTSLITQVDLIHPMMEQFLAGEFPKGAWE